MTTSTRRRKRSARGYLLLEVCVGGVMAAGVLGAVLLLVGGATRGNTIAARDATAQQLAAQGVEMARAFGMGIPDEAAGTALPVPAGLSGSYTRTREITSGTETWSGRTLNFKQITVVVSYPASDGTRTVTAQSRMYSD